MVMNSITKVQTFERDGVTFSAIQVYYIDDDGTLFDTGDLADHNTRERKKAYDLACKSI